MKIAVTTQNGMIFGHFGKCPLFTFYTVEEGKVVAKQEVDAAGSGHSALAGFLKANGADVVICGGIGMGARNMLHEAGIQLISGASGFTDQAVLDFLSGTLLDDPNNVCSHHDHGHGDTCGEHACGGHTCGGHTCGGHDAH